MVHRHHPPGLYHCALGAARSGTTMLTTTYYGRQVNNLRSIRRGGHRRERPLRREIVSVRAASGQGNLIKVLDTDNMASRLMCLTRDHQPTTR